MTGTTAATMRIGTTAIGGGAPLFVIAEIGLNHGGDPARALALVDAAAGAGASAVKLQTLRADDLVAPDRASGGATPRTSTRHRCATSSRASSWTRRPIAPSLRGPASTAWPGSRRRSTRPPSTCSSASACDALQDRQRRHHASPPDRAAPRPPASRSSISTGLSSLDEVGRGRDVRPRRRRAGASRCCTASRRIRRRTSQQNLARHPHAGARSACRSGSPITAADAAGVAVAVALGAVALRAAPQAARSRRSVIDAAVSSHAGGARATIMIARRARAARARARREKPPAGRGGQSGTASRRGALRGPRSAPGDVVTRPSDVMALRPERRRSTPSALARAASGCGRRADLAALEPFAAADLGDAVARRPRRRRA